MNDQVTAPDPRLEEIEAAEALVHVKCADCAKCRVAEEECWCPECEYWGCEQGPDCENDPKPTDVAYLLAELRKAQGALSDLLYVADNKAADTQVGRWWAEVIRGPIVQHLGDDGAARLRAAVADATGGERG